jgi:L-aminopeptidase/D-esterase-like protein
MTAGAFNALTDVPGIRVGHATRIGDGALTGTTCVLVPPGSVCAVDGRGGAPSTRETAALDPRYGVRHPDAIVLTGGSSYGLSTAHGVLDALWSEVEPLVPAAALFDLGRGGDFHAHPGPAAGVEALEAASGGPVAQGNVGAGTGAITAEMKGGLGTASVLLPGGIVVAALVAMNAHGSAVDPRDGLPYGHALGEGREFPLTRPDAGEVLAGHARLEETAAGRTTRKPLNTVIGVIATNAVLTHAETFRLAGAAQDGLPLAIQPSHCLGDGDTIFGVATGSAAGRTDLNALLAAAAAATARAVVHGVLAAESVTTPWGHIASYRELYPGAHQVPTSRDTPVDR